MSSVKFESKEIGLFDVNFETGERYWSRELRRMLALPEDAPADFHELLRRVHQDDRARVLAAAMQPFREGCPAQFSLEFRIVDDAGQVHWVHMERGTIFRRDQQSDAVRAIGFVFEIERPAAAVAA